MPKKNVMKPWYTAKTMDAVGIEPTTFHKPSPECQEMRSENHTPRPSALDLIDRTPNQWMRGMIYCRCKSQKSY